MAHEHPTRLSRRGMIRLMTGRPPDEGADEGADAGAGAGHPQASAWLEDGRAAFSAGDMGAAAEHLRLWLRRTPGDDAARMLLGRALYAMGRHVQAVVEFERVARRVPGHPAGLFLCLCRLRLGRAERALEAHAAWAAAVPPGPGAADAAALREHLAPHIEILAADPGQGERVAGILEQALETWPGLAAAGPGQEARG